MDPLQQNLESLRQAAMQSPDDINGWVAFCAQAEIEKNYAEVLFAGDKILRLAPDKPQPYFICGLALQYLDRVEEAISSYQRVIGFEPRHLDAWINLGHNYLALNRLAEAEEACRQAIEISGEAIADEEGHNVDPSAYGKHHWNLAMVQLLRGDYRRGFVRYASRLKHFNRPRPDFTQPQWHGEDLRGKTILIIVDQGHGDTLMMLRYLPLLCERGARVVLQVQPALVPFLKDWDGVDGVLAWGHDDLPPFDVYAYEFDLPRCFGTTLDTIPTELPYLPILPPNDLTRLPEGKNLKVGITWAGNPSYANDHKRSLPLSAFEPLFKMPNIDFFGLNRDRQPDDPAFLATHNVADLLAPQYDDFSVAARFVGQLDLIISCDTSIAHLAGGMGKPVWVLLPFAPSWGWMLERTDSLWYPTARLFRQKTRGDWASVIDDASAALTQFRVAKSGQTS